MYMYGYLMIIITYIKRKKMHTFKATHTLHCIEIHVSQDVHVQCTIMSTHGPDVNDVSLPEQFYLEGNFYNVNGNF